MDKYVTDCPRPCRGALPVPFETQRRRQRRCPSVVDAGGNWPFSCRCHRKSSLQLPKSPFPFHPHQPTFGARLAMLPRGQAGIRALAAVARHNRACPTVAGVVPRFTPVSTAPTLSRLGPLHARFNSTTGKDNNPETQPPSIDSQNIPSDPDKLTKQHKKHKWRYSKHGELDPDFSGKHPWVAGCLRLAISTAIGVLVVGGILLIHDASTYTERHVGRVPVNPLSLHPRRGGPKNLPIIEVNIDDEEDEQKRAMKDKPRLVILGGGWGVSLAAPLAVS